ncbi:MAG: 30S ribosomal protein S17e [archaeon]
MGRIKSTLIKRTSNQLLDDDKEEFSTSFEDNKKMLGDTMPSKSIRNKIAGYIGRLKKMQAKEAVNAKQ